MKKYYEAPEIMFEDFSLSTNIAGDCDTIVDTQSRGNCAMIGTGGIAVFGSTVDACIFKAGDLGGTDDQWDRFCYHVPIDESNLFNS